MSSQTAEIPDFECTSTKPTAVVLIADSFQSAGIDYLESLGCKIVIDPALQGDLLVSAIENSNPDILVVRSTKVTASMMDASEHLSIIIRAGAGFDTIDIQSASSRGISVANCPRKNSVAVAELTWGLILSCDRRIPDQVIDLKNGCWDKNEYSKAQGLFGRTIGIIGLGGIGQEIITRAQAFGMNVIAWSRSLTDVQAEQLGITRCKDVIELAKESDVVSVHVSSSQETKQLINEQFLAAMKDNAIFINTSRGSVVDEASLAEAVRAKGLRVGLDVYEQEPSSGDNTFNSPIIKEQGVYGTHHVGASTSQAQEAIATEAVRIIETFVREGRVIHCVNQSMKDSTAVMLSIRHKNLPGVLAHVFDELSISGINVEEMENILYKGEKAACARIQLSTIPTQQQLTVIKSNENILSVTLTTQQ